VLKRNLFSTHLMRGLFCFIIKEFYKTLQTRCFWVERVLLFFSIDEKGGS